MGVMKLTDADGTVGYLETTVDFASTNPSTPARTVHNREIVVDGVPVSEANPFPMSLVNWGSGAPVLGPDVSTQYAVPKFANAGGHLLANSSVLIDNATGLFTDVGFIGTLKPTLPSTVSVSTQQNDYNPGSSLVLPVNATANMIFSGFSGGTAGKMLIVLNVSSGSFTVTLANLSGSSQAANQISCGSSIVLMQHAAAILIHDGTVWRVLGATYNYCDNTFARNATFQRYFSLSQHVATQITSNQNNYAPSNNPYWQLSSDAACTITGMGNTATAAIRIIENVGSFPITFTHLDSNSSSANQFNTGDGDSIILLPSMKMMFAYDGKWKPLWTDHYSYTVANLPAVAHKGQMAFATNGRRSGEGPGSGTGLPVWYDGSAWRTYYDNGTITA